MILQYTDVIVLIEEAFSRLSPQLKRAARYVLDHPDDVALQSMRQVAGNADVHPSTMVRLARELGFDGHAQFQEPFQERLRSRPKDHYSGPVRSLQERGENGNAIPLIAEMFETEQQNFKAILDEVGEQALQNAADLLSGAGTVFVAGVRSCYPIAFYYHYASRMFSNNVVLAGSGGGTFADQLRGIGSGDVILAVSFAPYSRYTVRAVEYAQEHGASVLAITDSSVAPIARGKNTQALVVRTDSPSFFHSVVPALGVAQALVMLMAAGGGDEALKALQESEEQLSGFDAYVLDQPRWSAPQ